MPKSKKQTRSEKKNRTLLMVICKVAGNLRSGGLKTPSFSAPWQNEKPYQKSPTSDKDSFRRRTKTTRDLPESLATLTGGSTGVGSRPSNLTHWSLTFSSRHQISRIRPSKSTITGPVSTKHNRSKGCGEIHTATDGAEPLLTPGTLKRRQIPDDDDQTTGRESSDTPTKLAEEEPLPQN
ncbi:predicted protein [Arabidopsis lyrata subsp. lyrata]|uniref:Predicted protein n=1 Tax=Arabidopsis lyrata subsp. lyrata TaxID=81972 RepID=D7MLK9_ARALL|nr:predicted protein [Arabidopsis lyrata subsp. lyrata]